MNRKLNVLVVDDDDDDIYLTCDYLKAIDTFNINIDSERNYLKAFNRIQENKHDVYLVDYLLGPYTGIELIKQCNKAGIHKPFILLTGKGDRKIDMEATKAGAYDYLTKSELNTESLERSLRYSVQHYSSLNAIAESENRYKQIFTKSNDIIFVLDKNMNLINFNPMMTTLLGYADGELMNMPVANFFDRPAEGLAFAQSVEKCDVNDTEIVLMTKEGERKTFLSSCSVVNAAEGEPQYQVILYDYTNIKKSYAEKLIKEKIETTERLVRSLAHEIRNPLTSINLSLHQLEIEVGEDGKMLTDIIKRNSNRINEMIGELMYLSNPGERKNDKLELKALLKQVLAQAADRVKLRGITVIEKYTGTEAFLLGDQKKLQMALLNIVVNAIEAVEEQTGQITVETKLEGDEAAITITDNGPGISPDNLSSLFQPYFTGKKNGIGLGLATTHSFVQAHNGNIEVNSEVGKGTSFIVRLKTAAQPAVAN